MIPKPPFRIETERLVLRCYHPADAPLLKDAVDASRDHLLPWLPWAEAEPQPLTRKIELLHGFRGRFDLGADFIYGAFDPGESRVLGGAGLHPRIGPEAFEIGYWIRAEETGRGLATEIAAALAKAAFSTCAVDRIEIRSDPENHASMAIPRRLGFDREALLRRRLKYADGERRDVVVWTLFAEAFPSSPVARAEIRAFDALGQPIKPIAKSAEH